MNTRQDNPPDKGDTDSISLDRECSYLEELIYYYQDPQGDWE